MDFSSKRISSSVNQRNSSNQNSRSVGKMSNYAGKAPVQKLEEGQVIKGEITDLRNKEVTILLEDNTQVTGKLDQVNWLCIGDAASFRVTEIQPGKISLQAIPLSNSAIESNTMFKALEEAGLPHTSRNQTIVLSLIRNQLPITKPSILDILKQSYEFKEADINTIVLMNKYNIPATHENALQFELYQNHENKLSSLLTGTIDSLPSMLRELAFYSDDTIGEKANELFSVLDLGENASTSSAQDALESYLFSSEKMHSEVLSILSDFDLPEETINAIKDGTISLTQLNQVIEECFENAKLIDERNQNGVLNTLTPEELVNPQTVNNALADVPHIVDAFDTSSIHQIQNDYAEYMKNNQMLGGFLDAENRNAILDFLKSANASPEIMDEIKAGSLSLHDTLNVIKNAMSTAEPQAIQQLFQSDAFATLMSNELSNQWKLSPNQIRRENGVKQFYGKIYAQAKGIQNLMESVNPDLRESDFGSNLSSVKQNVDFMQQLNQIFPYVQLPFDTGKFPGHAELYVYTKKEELKTNSDNLTVLLHLALDNLGKLDVHITKNGLSLQNKFYIDDGQSKRLVKKNVMLLESKLRELGFSVTTEFPKKEQEVDVINDFITHKNDSEEIKRYSFDIRA